MQDAGKSGLDWRDAPNGQGGRIPVSRRFDDPYFSLDDGLAETAYVFHGGNDLPNRFCDGFHVAELGFGTGLNLLATLQLWRQSGAAGRLFFSSFEAYPLERDDYAAAHSAFPSLATEAHQLDPIWQGATALDLPDLCFRLHLGDARQTLPLWHTHADAWFLDGFSPAKNPELWEPALLNAVFAHTAPQGSAATYSAAGHVRRCLTNAGFDVTRAPGYGRKRHMTIARKV